MTNLNIDAARSVLGLMKTLITTIELRLDENKVYPEGEKIIAKMELVAKKLEALKNIF